MKKTTQSAEQENQATETQPNSTQQSESKRTRPLNDSLEFVNLIFFLIIALDAGLIVITRGEKSVSQKWTLLYFVELFLDIIGWVALWTGRRLVVILIQGSNSLSGVIKILLLGFDGGVGMEIVLAHFVHVDLRWILILFFSWNHEDKSEIIKTIHNSDA